MAGSIRSQFTVIGFLIMIGLIVDKYEKSSLGMIREANDHPTETKGYVMYIKEHPNGKYKEEAKDSLLSIFNKVKIDDVESGCRACRDLRSVFEQNLQVDDDFSLRLDSFSSMFISETCNQMVGHYYSNYYWESLENALPEREKWKFESIRNEYDKSIFSQEKPAWIFASEANTPEAYEKYIKFHPNGKHAKEAKKASIDIEVDRIFSNDHGYMPQMVKNSKNGKKSSLITIMNNTSFALTVCYSGNAESKRVVVIPNGSSTVNLPNGLYRVSARVSNINVRPFAGNETIDGGNYSTSFYIETRRY